MPGTKAGGVAAAATNKKKYGADFHARIGAKGGRNGTGHEFGHGKVDPHVAGSICGKISRRPKRRNKTLA